MNPFQFISKLISVFCGVGLILCVLTLSSPAIAVTDAHIGYCDDIESTAAALKCITDHKENAEKELKKIFETLHKAIEDEKEDQREKFLDAHKNWITYRDAQCAWESDFDTPALVKLYELSCVAKLTEQRTSRLLHATGLKEAPEKASEFGAFPKWLNLLYKNYPDIVWDVKSQKAHDFTCDGQKDFLIQGVSSVKSEGENDHFMLNTFIAIIDGAEIAGKPAYDLIEIPVKRESLCTPMPDISYDETSCPTLAHIYISPSSKECQEESLETISIIPDEKGRYVLKQDLSIPNTQP